MKMARNKHPEETVDLILDVAFSLFMKKGYEHTSIQDIIDHLGGLSKGAIYHHFKSKEDIYIAITDRMTRESNRILKAICRRSDLNGKEKLRAIFTESIFHPAQEELFTTAPDLNKNPKLLISIVRDTVGVLTPDYILPIIKQGISDGSIRTDYPAELAELVMLTANVWMNPLVFEETAEKICRKFMVFRQMMQGFGLDIVDDDLLGRLQELAEMYQKNKQEGSDVYCSNQHGQKRLRHRVL